MIEQLPALQVVLPLFSALLCLLIRNKTASRLFAVAVSWGCLAIALILLQTVQESGIISYHLGGWFPPLGIEYRIDLLNAYVLIIVAMISAVVLPFGFGHWGLSIPEGREYLFYCAFLLCISGLLGITITGDVFNVFVFLEITSLSSYALIAIGRSRRALRAAFTYLVMGTVGGTFILIGIGMM